VLFVVNNEDRGLHLLHLLRMKMKAEG
jgi:hypothetical protein